MRAYIHQHRSEFLEEGQDLDSTSLAETASISDSTSLGGSTNVGGEGTTLNGNDGTDKGLLGTVMSTMRTLLDSIGGVTEAFGELSPTSMALAFVVLVLVLSNLWTLGSRSGSGSSRQPLGGRSTNGGGGGGADRTPDQVALAVRDVLRDYFADPSAAAGGGGGGRPSSSSRSGTTNVVDGKLDLGAEVADINAVLDDLEARIARLRGALEQVE